MPRTANTKVRPSAKKAPAKKTLLAKVAKTPKTKEVKPVKKTFTKAALILELSDRCHLDKKVVASVLSSLEDLMLGAVHPRGVGEFSIPGLFKVVTKKVPARKGGKTATSPFTGETYTTKAKPATVRVRIRTGTKLKASAVL